MKATLLNRILLVLAFVGLFIAGTLSIEAATGQIVPCGPASGCATVANHPSSKLFGAIPVAYIGVLGYLILAGLAAYRAAKGVHATRSLVMAGYIVAAIGTVASLYLQYVSFFVIGATCIWCLSSALLMVVTLIVHAVLAQELDTNPTGPDQAPGLGAADRSLVAGLPIALVVGLAFMGMTMKAGDKASSPTPKLADMKDVEFVPAEANIYGQKDAPLTIVEFADILCPACQRTSPQVKEFVTSHPGKARLVYRHYPLQTLHPQAMAAASIAEVAADQGKFWDFTLAVMGKEMKPESPEELLDTARLVGIDTVKVRDRLSDKNDVAFGRIARDLQAVKKLGITSTPTFFLLDATGKVIDTAGPAQIVERLSRPDIEAIMNPKNAKS